jgi:hypothetical protein
LQLFWDRDLSKDVLRSRNLTRTTAPTLDQLYATALEELASPDSTWLATL